MGTGTFSTIRQLPLTQIVANLEFEMIGRPDAGAEEWRIVADGIRAVESGAYAGLTRRGDLGRSAPGSALLSAVG